MRSQKLSLALVSRSCSSATRTMACSGTTRRRCSQPSTPRLGSWRLDDDDPCDWKDISGPYSKPGEAFPVMTWVVWYSDMCRWPAGAGSRRCPVRQKREDNVQAAATLTGGGAGGSAGQAGGGGASGMVRR